MTLQTTKFEWLSEHGFALSMHDGMHQISYFLDKLEWFEVGKSSFGSTQRIKLVSNPIPTHDV